jgi:hypothetical protein
MARFTTTGGSGDGAPGPQGPAGEDAVLPQDLDTTDSPTFSKITLTSNGAVDNITIGDDVILGDGNIANHVVIIGQQDSLNGGIVLGERLTEILSSDGSNLSLDADNDIIFNPGSTYAYIGTPQLDGSNRIAKMSDITGATGEPGADGEDALWNFTGAYNGGASYAIGDIVTYDGQLWYRAHANGGTVGNVPSESFIWNLLAAKGTDGTQGEPGTDATGGLVFLGNYISGNGYIANIAVVRGSDDNLYIAKDSGGLQDPVGNTAQWDILSYGYGNGGTGGDLVIPFIIKDENGNDLLGFEKGGTGVTRINALQDDLALRSSNDIILYPGDDGPGHVYIGWGDATYTPNATNRVATIADIQSANIADFVFTDDSDNTGRSIISLPGDKGMTIAAGADSDLYLTAGDDLYIETLGEGDDIHINAADDIRFSTANNLVDNPTSYYWRMDSEGKFQLPGNGYIENPISSSGDGSGYDTLKLVPDDNLTYGAGGADQYIIIDPTSPNHIHIRAGGTQDESTADLFLGGERNNIRISDPYRIVTINTKPQAIVNTYGNSNQASNTEFMHATGADIFVGDTVRLYTGGDIFTVTSVTQEYPYAGLMTVIADGLSFITGEAYTFTREQSWNYEWAFGNDGVLSGPAQGAIRVNGIEGNTGNPLYLNSTEGVVLSGNDGSEDNGVFLNNTNPENQVATIGDISSTVPVETSFTVNGGSLGTMPTFDGAPLFSGSYVKTGPLVNFQIQVDMDNILTFGDGQYYIDLPFPAKYGYQFKEGCLHDISTGRQYAVGGHVYAGQSQVLLTFTDSAGQDELFDYNSPVTLSTADNFHIAGTYITS